MHVVIALINNARHVPEAKFMLEMNCSFDISKADISAECGAGEPHCSIVGE